ncbi:hypothetical protein KC460_04750 [Candidatus Dependentiae bacterium]|nr:hypothetical protein [Candidatus Dependentiae bacterium]
MSFRVIHHEGDKDLLIEKIKVAADQLKSDEYKDNFDFDEGEWERAVDSVVSGDLSNTELVFLVLHLAINSYFPPVSEDCGISAYETLADKTSGKLAKTLQMFVDGRSFSTGNVGFGFGDEINCGYLTSDEVREFLGLLKAYTPVEGEEEFVAMLIETFSTLVEKNSGDLFIMG